ncbi:MAG: TetR family transcriptional regulator [Clostridia bacterium]|nr:TetR family transcriptional regulator [Clostridia bacterium]
MVKKQAKLLLEQALMQMLEKSSLDKIDVRELAAKSGLSRQTFYYNFKNKQDMVDWLCDKNNEKSRHAYWENNSFSDYILTALNTISQYRLFYIYALPGNNDKGVPGPFERGIISLAQEIELRGSQGRMDSEQWEALIFFAYGAKGMVMRWLTEQSRSNVEELARVIINNIPIPLKEYFAA